MNELYFKIIKDRLEWLLNEKITNPDSDYLRGLIDATKEAINTYEICFGKEVESA